MSDDAAGNSEQLVPEWGLDAALVVGGVSVWVHGAIAGNALGPTLGFLCIVMVLATRMGWL